MLDILGGEDGRLALGTLVQVVVLPLVAAGVWRACGWAARTARRLMNGRREA